MTDFIDGALGQDSQFHVTHGFYVHGISIEAATLPAGWSERTIEISHPVATRGHSGNYCGRDSRNSLSTMRAFIDLLM